MNASSSSATWSESLREFAKNHWRFILLASVATATIGFGSLYLLSSSSTHAKSRRSADSSKRNKISPENDSDINVESNCGGDISIVSKDVDDIIKEGSHDISSQSVGNGDKFLATSNGNDLNKEESEEDGCAVNSATGKDTVAIDLSSLSDKEREEMALSAKNRGNKYYAAQKYEKAITLYSKAIDLYPATDKRCAVYFSNRAACWLNLNEFAKALDDCNNALIADNSYVKAISRRGNVYEKLDHLTEALEDLTTACIIEEFKNQSTVLSADRVLRALVAVRSKEVFGSLKHDELPSISFVTAYLNSFNYVYLNAEEKANLVPGSGDALFAKAVSLFEKKDWEKAEKACSAAIKASPQKFMARALNMRGTFLFLRGLSDAAKDDFEESLRLEPDNVNTIIKMANVVMEQKLEEGLDETMGLFDRALKISPNEPDVFYHRGQIYFLVQQYEKAMVDYEKTLSLNGNFVIAKVQLAIVNYRLQKFDTAKSIFEEAQKQFPKSSEVYYYQGETLLDQQRVEEALVLFDRAIEANPSSPLAYLNKGIIHFHMLGDLEKAMEYTQKAIEVDPRCDLAYSHLAQMYMQQARLDEAIIVYKRAIDLARTLSDVESAVMGLEAVKAQSAALRRIRSIKQN